MAKELLRSLASGRGTFVKMASVVPDGFEVAVDSKLSSRRVRYDRKHKLISGRCGSVELFLQQFLCRFGAVGAYDVI